MAKVQKIDVESGVSIETAPNVWYKFKYGMTVEIEEGDNLSDVKRKAWNTAHDEIAKQVADLQGK